MLVVPAEVAGERARAVAAAGVGEAVCPFAQQCFEERFGFTVGLRPSGAGVAAGDAELCAGGRPSVRAVAVAVVAEDAFDGDAAVAVPAEGAAEEGDAIGGALARQQLCVGQARVVIDREVQVLPAGVTVAREPVAMDALADRPETAELLDVDVNELARPLALVADDRAPCRSRQPRDAIAAEHLPHGRGWQAELSGHDQRARLRVLARRQDPPLELPGQPAGLMPRHRRPVGERRPAALLVAAPEPVTGGTARTASGRGRLRTLSSKNTGNKTATRLEREPHPSRRLRSVEHSGPPKRAGVSTTARLAGGPDAISRLAGV